MFALLDDRWWWLVARTASAEAMTEEGEEKVNRKLKSKSERGEVGDEEGSNGARTRVDEITGEEQSACKTAAT